MVGEGCRKFGDILGSTAAGSAAGGVATASGGEVDEHFLRKDDRGQLRMSES
jgi:hypothetical protein